MRTIYAIAKPGLTSHIFCCMQRAYTVDLPGGYEMVVGIPQRSESRAHCSGGAECLLPTRESGIAVGTAAAAYFPAAWGILATDTTAAALAKAFTATGFHWLDPEL